MRDANHLMIAPQRLHLRANCVRNFAAYIRVDFIEHEEGNRIMRASADLIASIRREISPLDAMARSDLSGSPGLGEKSNSTESNPFGRGSSSGMSFASNSDWRIRDPAG